MKAAEAVPTALHPRLTVCGYPLRDSSLDDDFAFFEKGGIHAVGLSEAKARAFGWRETAALGRRHKVRIDYLVCVSMFSIDDPSAWGSQTERLVAVLDGAAQLGARAVYGTTGPAGSLSWEEAADRFATAVRPALAHARRIGIDLLVENQNPLAQSVSFVTPLGDLVELAELADLGICVDLFHCWRDRAFEATFARGLARVGMVQVGDYAVGIRQMGERVVPGDGIIPVARLLGAMVAAGYRGTVDLEITGSRIDQEGRQAAFLRGARFLSDILYAADAPSDAS